MKQNKLLLAFLIVFSLVGLQTKAQPCGPMSPSPDNCTNCVGINLPPPVTICPGASYVFTPTVIPHPGFTVTGYNWTGTTVTPASGPGLPPSTTITPPVIVPIGCTTASYTYTLSVDGLGPNVILNPYLDPLIPLNYCTDFTNTTPPLLNDTYYTICPNGNAIPGWLPGPPDFFDHTTGTPAGSMFIGQADPNVNVILQQDVPVCPGEAYKFSFWHAWLHTSTTMPTFYVTILNGAGMPISTTPFPSMPPSDTWTQASMTWTNPAPYTTATIVIHCGGPVPSPGGWGLMPSGTVFAIDDLSLNRVCKSVGRMTVNVEYPEIKGPTTVCVGDIITLSGCTPGGTWSSSAPGIASVDPMGNVTGGPLSGVAIITYTTPSGCTATYPITVNPLPILAGPPDVCVGSTVSWTPSGGSWSSSDPGIATVDAMGNVTGVSPGTATLTYADPVTGCKNTGTVTVHPRPIHVPTVHICMGSSTTLIGSPVGGSWISTGPGIATITPGGFLTGISPGVTTVIYTTLAGCSDTTTVHVYDCAGGGGIVGRDLCIQESVQFLTAIGIPPGGAWSSSAPTVASVDPLTGVVTTSGGVGPVTITYTLGLSSWSITITVHAMETACVVTNCCPYVFNFTSSCPTAVIYYTVYDFAGNPIATGTTGVGTMPYMGGDTSHICIDSFTCGPCTWPGYCCAYVNHPKAGSTNIDNNNIEDDAVSIVPNPNNGTFRIAGSIDGIVGNKKIKLIITDVLGKVIYSDAATTENGTIDKSISLGDNIPNGIYYIRISGINENKTLKVVLDR